jgi:glutamate racemase
LNAVAPIGVFDSGIGGLSILRALRAELAQEHFVYVADSAHAPYGERDDAYVIARCRTLAQHLRTQHRIKALVVACNTATAAAIHLLRQEYPDLPIIGVEPALKPAVAASQTRRIGVMATRSTLASIKFKALLDSVKGQAEFICQACDGLADAIERQDAQDTLVLCSRHTAAMGRFGAQPGAIDTVVLGCTHYPLAAELIQALLGPSVRLLDSGAPVAHQTRRLLQAAHQLAPDSSVAGQLLLCATGQTETLLIASRRWLHPDSTVRRINS